MTVDGESSESFVRRHFEVIRMVVMAAALVAFAAFAALRVVAGIQAEEIRACHRLNIERAEMNRNWLAAYDLLAPRSVPRSSRGGVAALRVYADRLAWTPLTNCETAVHSNQASPNPIRYADRRPPRSALYLGPNN